MPNSRFCDHPLAYPHFGAYLLELPWVSYKVVPHLWMTKLMSVLQWLRHLPRKYRRDHAGRLWVLSYVSNMTRTSG